MMIINTIVAVLLVSLFITLVRAYLNQ